MATDSSVAGYLVPDTAPPAPVPKYGEDLEDIFHDVIQGVLGFSDGSLIRPRWQPEPPNQPAFTEDWVAFGVMVTKGDWNPYQSLDPAGAAGAGSTTFERDEELTLLYSFYGPNGMALQSQHEDGLLVEQNRDELTANGIKLIGFLDAYNLPALLKERWVKRVDQRAVFRRRIRRTYSIRYLLNAGLNLDNEQYITEIVTP